MKLKNLFSGLLFAAGITSVLGMSIYVSKADTDGDWEYSTTFPFEDICTITGYNGNDTEVTIPYKVNGIPVESVKIRYGSDDSNENLKNVKKVTFASGYEKMNNTAITGFANVEELVIPDTVSVIEYNAFYELANLKSVQLPSSLRKIEENAFRGCKSLESLTVPEGVVKIEWGAFGDCTGLKSVTVPDSAELEYDVFRNCLGLKDENGMVIVNDHLYHMDIPAGTTEITIPDGIKVLEGELFDRNKKIKKVTIPEGVTRIEHRVFLECSNLEEVIVPDSVNYIGTYAFYNCVSLKTLKLPSDFERGMDPFSGCKALQDEKGFVIINGLLCDYYGNEESVVIPDGIKEIEQYCFNLKPIKEISLPDSLTYIGVGAFQNCTELKKVEIPDSVTGIGRSAFLGCDSVSEVKLSKNLKKLDSSVLSGTSNLKKLVVPEGVEEILDEFKDSGIEELTLPASLKTLVPPDLKDGAKVIFNGTPEQWKKLDSSNIMADRFDLVILKVTPVPTATNTATPTPVPSTATPEPTVTTEPVLTPAVTTVPETTITAAPTPEVTAAPDITTAPSATAEPTVAVTATPAPDSFKVNGNTYKIKGKNATLIKGAKKAKVVIPATVKFNGKKYKVTAIGTSAFKSNKKLKSVTIGKNVKSIGKKAFYKASKLSSVTIKSKLLKSTKVGKNAFKGVSKKVVFKVPATKKKAYSKMIAKSAKRYKIS